MSLLVGSKFVRRSVRGYKVLNLIQLELIQVDELNTIKIIGH